MPRRSRLKKQEEIEMFKKMLKMVAQMFAVCGEKRMTKDEIDTMLDVVKVLKVSASMTCF